MAKVALGSEKVTIKIPRPLYGKIAYVIEGAGYNSVTDFVVYVLRDLVASHEYPARPTGNHGGARDHSEGERTGSRQGERTGKGPAFGPSSRSDELEQVKQRLRALGYLGQAEELGNDG